MQASAKTALSTLVEQHLENLVREAACVQRHSKRARRFGPLGGNSSSNSNDNDFNDDDNNNASSSSSASSWLLRSRLHAEDVNLALQWRGSEKLYASAAAASSSATASSQDNNNSPPPCLRPMNLNAYLKSENPLAPPSELGLTTHWLAIDGVQPPLLANPTGSSSIMRSRKRKATTTSAVHTIEPDDDDEDDDDDSEKPEDDIITDTTTKPTTTTSDSVQVQQLLPRLVSEELQLYWTRLTTALTTTTTIPTTTRASLAAAQEDMLQSVAVHAGLQELVPFMVQLTCQQLQKHLHEPSICRTWVRLAKALLRNPHLHLELHLHQLLPWLLTCVVARQLTGDDNRRFNDDEQHWALRREAAETVWWACQIFGEEYSTLRARVLRTFGEALTNTTARTTQYGGLVGITLFGPKAVDAFVLPKCMEYYALWDNKLNSGGAASSDDGDDILQEADKVELQQCQQALLNALAVFLRRVNVEEQAARISWLELEDTLGADVLVALVPMDDDDYVQCGVV